MSMLFLDSGMAEAFHIIQSHPPNSSMEQRKVFTPSDGEKYPLWWIQNKFKGEHGSTAKGKMLEVVGGNWPPWPLIPLCADQGKALEESKVPLQICQSSQDLKS